MAYIFTNILDKATSQGVVPGKTADARDWFRDAASNVNRVNAQQLLNTPGSTANRPLPGRMFMFFYDAKTKQELPYFDKFPLIFMVGPAEGGFYGINLHYLPPILRARLMDALYDTINNNNYDDTTRLRISYDILKKASKMRYFKPTFKLYLNSNVRSRFLYISPEQWDIALFLPTERFTGARKDRVWRESREKIFRT